MQDPINIPACFSSTSKLIDDPSSVTRAGQSVLMSIYRSKMANQSYLITVTWCKNVLVHALSVTISDSDTDNQYICKVELKPWCFWRKQGSKRFLVDGNKAIDVFWDLKNAKFNGETEPNPDYYVAVVCNDEVVLLLGDLRKEAYKKSGARPSLIDPVLVSRREHVFGKRKFSTRVKFHEKGRFHEISIECKNRKSKPNSNTEFEPEMEIRIDGHLVIHVKHLQWKFRGNESIHFNKSRVEVYWDVHDWLFSPGLRNGLFIFKPSVSTTSSTSLFSNSSSSSPPPLSSPLSSQTGSCSSLEGLNAVNGLSEFCLFLYAWKVE